MQYYFYALGLLVLVLLGLGLYLFVARKPSSSAPPPPTTQSVFMLGKAGGVFQSALYAQQPFTSGVESKDMLLASVLAALRSGVDANAAVASADDIAAAVSTLPGSLAGFYADAPIDSAGAEQVLLVNNNNVPTTVISPMNWGTLQSFAFVRCAMPTDDWVQATLIPLGVTISTGPTSYVPMPAPQA